MSNTSVLDPDRLTVHPHAMPLGTENQFRGIRALASGKNYFLYVPTLCEGARRCPLLVYLSPESALGWQLSEAERYGVLVLAAGNSQTELVDTALKEVLTHYAIDPDKIALAGFSALGMRALELGYHNSDIFSRVAVLSAPNAASVFRVPVVVRDTTTQFFVSGGIDEGGFKGMDMLENSQSLRKFGYPVQEALGFRVHEHYPEDYSLLWRWLCESWKIPTFPTLGNPPFLDPLPVLTPRIVAQLDTFWERFMKEPDSIRWTAREAHLHVVSISVGTERPLVITMNLSTLAAEYPSVAADLQAAGLTAQQAESYRLALLSAIVVGKDAQVHAWVSVMKEHPDTSYPSTVSVPIPPGGTLGRSEGAWRQTLTIVLPPLTAVLGTDFEANAEKAFGATETLRKNVTFVLTHTKELEALRDTGMWIVP